MHTRLHDENSNTNARTQVQFAVTYSMLLRPLKDLPDASNLVEKSLSLRKQSHSLIVLSKLKDALQCPPLKAYSMLIEILEKLDNALDCPCLLKVFVLFHLGFHLKLQKLFDRSLQYLERASKLLELEYGVGELYIRNEMSSDIDRQQRGHAYHVCVLNEIFRVLQLKGEAQALHLSEPAELAVKLFESTETFVPVWDNESCQKFSLILRVVYVRLYQIKNKMEPEEDVKAMIEFFQNKFENVRHDSSVTKSSYLRKFRESINAVKEMGQGLNCNLRFSTVSSKEKKKSTHTATAPEIKKIKNPSILCWFSNHRVRVSRILGKKLLHVLRVVPNCSVELLILFLYNGFHQYSCFMPAVTVVQRVRTHTDLYVVLFERGIELTHSLLEFLQADSVIRQPVYEYFCCRFRKREFLSSNSGNCCVFKCRRKA